MISIPSFIIGNNTLQNDNAKKQTSISIPIVISAPFLNCPPHCCPIFCIPNPILINENDACKKNQVVCSEAEQQKSEKPENTLQQSTSKKKLRNHFTKEEDEKIKELVKIFGTHNWILISEFMVGRTPKQIRDRYSNYLIPGIFLGEWSKEEDELLIKLYGEYGSKWSIIQTFFPKRSTNSIKNRWHYFLNKKFPKNIERKEANSSYVQEIPKVTKIENDSNNVQSVNNDNVTDDIIGIDMLGDLNFEEWCL
ncbi:hypothetical protein M9Y10_031151 [Tritrichomonas musculus]|uniref:Myb-like DNA-binding domain containing protein n=1 Tax=Tritrichomonas musculus TaxID=1915356 RepID=A0ABR2H359_9EUKA